MISAPCKDCNKRHEACHSNCSDYISYKEQLEVIRAEERRLKNLERPIRKIIKKSIWRDV